MDSIGIRIGLLVSAEDLAMPSMNVDLMGVATFEVTGGLWKLILDDTTPPPGVIP